MILLLFAALGCSSHKDHRSEDAQAGTILELNQTTTAGTVRGVNLYCLVGTNTPQINANCIEIAQVIERIDEPYIQSHLHQALYFLSQSNVNWIRTVLWADLLTPGNYPIPTPTLIAKYNRFAAIVAEHGITINFMLIGPMVRLIGPPDTYDPSMRDAYPYTNDKIWISTWVDGVMAVSKNIGNILILGDGSPCNYSGHCWPEHQDVQPININHAKYIMEMWPWFRARYPNYQAGVEYATATLPNLIRATANWTKAHAPGQSYYYATMYEHGPRMPLNSAPIAYAAKAVAAIEEFDRARTGLALWVDEYGMGFGGQEWGDRAAQAAYFQGTLHALSCHFPGRNFPKFVWDFGPNPGPFGSFGIVDGYNGNGAVIPAPSWGAISHFYRRTSCASGAELPLSAEPVPTTRRVVAEAFQRYLNRPATPKDIENNARAIAGNVYSHLGIAEMLKIVPEALQARRNAIAQAYLTYLKRPASETDIAIWDPQIRDTLTFEQFTVQVSYSEEALTLLTREAFQAYLGRDADAAAIRFYVQKMAHQGLTREDFVLAVAYSQEAANLMIRNLYGTYLGHDADDHALGIWTGKLVCREMTREQVVQAIVYSEEALTLLVRQTFQISLGRPATAGDIAFWFGLMSRRERTRETFVDEISHCEEAANFLVRRLYRAYLSREADEIGLRCWTGKFIRREMTRAQVSAGIINSEEGLSLLVRQTFQAYLGRAATAGDVSFWFGAMSRGERTREGFVDLIVHSEEGSNFLVRSLYKTYLNRDAEDAGLRFWSGKLIRREMTREQVADAVAYSEEGLRIHIRRTYLTHAKREPLAGEISYWFGVMARRERTRETFVDEIRKSNT